MCEVEVTPIDLPSIVAHVNTTNAHQMRIKLDSVWMRIESASKRAPCERAFTVLFQIFLGPVCIPGNALNFTMSTNFTASGETACLACLFDGISPQSGTIWLVNGVSIKTSSPFLQVNSNGALIIRQPRNIFFWSDSVILSGPKNNLHHHCDIDA